MLELLMLDEVGQTKLKIYAHFSTLQSSILNLATLCETLECSYARLQSLLDEIDQDMEKMNSTSLRDVEGKFEITEHIFDYNAYQQYLIRDGIPYRFLLTSLIDPEITLQDFFEQNFTSRSSMARKLRPLADYLATLGIKLNRSQLKLQGEEQTLRLVYFNFIWFGSYGEDVFAHISIADKLQRDDRWVAYIAPVNPQEWRLRLTIGLLRQQQGHFIRHFDFEGLTLPQLKDPYETLMADYYVSPQQKKDELTYLAYLAFYWPNYYLKDDPRLDYVETTLVMNPLGLTQLIREMIKDITGRLVFSPIDQDTRRLLEANLFIAFYNQRFSSYRLPMISAFMREQMENKTSLYPVLHHYVSDYLHKRIQETSYDWLEDKLDDLTFLCTFILLPQFELSKRQKKLTVGIIAIPNFLLLHELQDFLENLNYTESLVLASADQKDCDFYIATSTYLLKDVPPEKAYIISFSGKSDYIQELFQLLKTAHVELNISATKEEFLPA